MYRVAGCVVTTTAAFAVALFVSAHGPSRIFLLFIPALFACAALAGRRGGLLSLLLSLPAITYLLPPHNSITFEPTLGTCVALMLYLVIGVLIIHTTSSLKTGIAERERLLAQLRDQAAELEAVLSSMADGLMVFAPSGKLLSANKAALRLLGCPEEKLAPLVLDGESDVDGARTCTFQQEDGKPFPVDELPARLALQGKLSSGTVLGLSRPDGSRRWFSCSAAPVLSGGDKLICAVVSIADITRGREMEAQLRQTAGALATADRRKGEFLAILGHELRNPLAAISSAVQLLKLDPHNPSTARLLTIISRQTTRMARMVDDLLDLSRIDRGQFALRYSCLDAREVVRAAIESSRQTIDARSHELLVMLPERPLYLEGDEVRLEQIVSNLLDNAAKYTPDHGRIWVSAERQGEQVVFRVKDTGVGISAEALPHVFDLFARGNEAVQRSEGGLGIGLALVRNLVEMHGGTVEATSEGRERGSEFWVRLPALPAEVSPEPVDTTEKAEPRAHPGYVLVVDDNQDFLETLSATVRHWGFRVQAAPDGRTALAIAIADPPDVAVLDIGMPDLDGYQLARLFRAQLPDGINIRLVALTGHGQPEDRRRAEAAGFHRHMTKPVDMSELRRVLEAS